jgi:hypothetical protein
MVKKYLAFYGTKSLLLDSQNHSNGPYLSQINSLHIFLL